jgi:hypothetical protein
VSQGPAILKPAEYRARAQKCRDMARLVPATELDFLAAAATWEALADQATALLRYEQQVKKSAD